MLSLIRSAVRLLELGFGANARHVSRTRSCATPLRTRLNLQRLEAREVPATWPVTNTNADGAGSLSQAITSANTSPDASAVIDVQVAGTISLTHTLPTVGKTVTINTTAAGITVGRAATAGNFRIFEVGASATAVVNKVTFRDGRAEEGAGIYNSGNLTLSHCVVTNNENVPGMMGMTGRGGGIYNTGTLQLLEIDIKSNKAQDGAGIYNAGGYLDANNLTGQIFSNTATRNGGGIYNGGDAYVGQYANIHDNLADYGAGIYNTYIFSMTNGIVSTNTATTGGGGIYSTGTTDFTGTEIKDNKAWPANGSKGGGYYVSAGATTFTNCTFSGNVCVAVGGGDCGYSLTGTVTRAGCTEQPAADYVEF